MQDKNLGNITAHFSEVRYIEDGKDYVDAEHTNRPHKDIVTNIDILASIENVRQGLSQGAWQSNVLYSVGDIVAFLSDYYVSLKNNNQGNTPIPPSTAQQDEYWQVLSGVSGVEVKNLMRGGSISNGKDFVKFNLKANTQYTLYLGSKNLFFSDRYNLLFDFENAENTQSQKPDFSKLDTPLQTYIELEINYTGHANTNNQKIPELYFHKVQTNTMGDKSKWTFDEDFNSTYGLCAVVFQSGVRLDETISIVVTPRFDCVLKVSGNYTTPLYAGDDSLSVVATFKESMFYQVADSSGDLAHNILEYIPAESILQTDYEMCMRGYIKSTNQKVGLSAYFRALSHINTQSPMWQSTDKILALPQSNSEYFIKVF